MSKDLTEDQYDKLIFEASTKALQGILSSTYVDTHGNTKRDMVDEAIDYAEVLLKKLGYKITKQSI